MGYYLTLVRLGHNNNNNNNKIPNTSKNEIGKILITSLLGMFVQSLCGTLLKFFSKQELETQYVPDITHRVYTCTVQERTSSHPKDLASSDSSKHCLQ